MPSTPDNEAFNYAERIRARLPRTLQQAREVVGVSCYALEKRSAVSRDMIGDVEKGKANPTLHLAARLAHGLGDEAVGIRKEAGGLTGGERACGAVGDVRLWGCRVLW